MPTLINEKYNHIKNANKRIENLIPKINKKYLEKTFLNKGLGTNRRIS